VQPYKNFTTDRSQVYAGTFQPRIVADAYFLGTVKPADIDLIPDQWTFASFRRLRELANQEANGGSAAVD